jgi:hypothetical protein
MSQPSSAGAPAAEFLARLRAASIQPQEIAKFLDGLRHAERVEAIRAAGRSEQRRLWEAVKGVGSVRNADLVPPSVGDLVPVRHHGRNTLPAFNFFEKRFCRPPGADRHQPEKLFGFNFQSMSWLTGPGYYVSYDRPGAPEVDIDYRELPTTKPADWPAIRSNDRGLGRLVYGNMVDTLRRVSEHVTIGSAAKGGRELGSWFLLCRED